MLKKDSTPLLRIWLNTNEICQVSHAEIPCEKRISTSIPATQSELIFHDHAGKRYVHALYEKGWIHLSVRCHPSLACQIDCVLSEAEKFAESDLVKSTSEGIRFQPFFITGGAVDDANLAGKGLLERGLHFSSVITPGNVSLSCICDKCKKSFRIKSFHTGFSNLGYFYSESGSQTLVVNSFLDGAPPAIGKPDFEKLAILEAHLPKAKDGTRFKYKNSFRCPHCGSAYIDFERFPEQREREYYGNYFYGDEIIKFEPENDA
ncbi:MAG: hypothetical protein WHV44_03825 [Anaerolineales bacterium]